MKKILSLFVATMLLVQPLYNTFGAFFSDLDGVAGDLVDSISELAADGVINGYGDGTYRPNSPISEQELARLLLRTRGESEVVSGYTMRHVTRIEALRLMVSIWNIAVQPGSSTFEDLPAADQGVAALFQQRGVVRGYTTKIFGSDVFLTRAEAAKIVLKSRSAFQATGSAVSVSQNVVRIIDVSPMTLRPSGSGSVLFVINNNGDPETGLVYNDDYFASVVSGGVTITGANELGAGLYQLTFRAPSNAASGPINIRITVMMGSVYSTDITEFLNQKNTAVVTTPTISLAQLIPAVVSSGNTAQIVVTPQDQRGRTVSGLEIYAEVTKGSGDIVEQIAESPAGSGVYVGTYKARGASGSEIEITVRINNIASRPQTIVRGTVR